MKTIYMLFLMVLPFCGMSQMTAADSVEFSKLVKKFVVEKDEFRETVSYRHRMFQEGQMGFKVYVSDTGPYLLCSYINQHAIGPEYIEFKINGEFHRLDFTSTGPLGSPLTGYISESAGGPITPGLIADVASVLESGEEVLCRITGINGIVDLKIQKKFKTAWVETQALCRLICK